jgi:putative ABC transport system ATP-binding protein
LIPEVITAVYAATSIILFGVGTWVISQGSFNGAGMVSFVTSLVLLIEPIQAMGKAYNELKQGEPAIERLFELTTFSPKVLEKQGTVTLKTVAGDVELCDVSFRYKGSVSWVLKDISLRVHAGQTVALVGPSGGGKTTLAKLLLRLYDPVQGSIKIDGHDIRECSLKSLRQQVAIVPQETVLSPFSCLYFLHSSSLLSKNGALV